MKIFIIGAGRIGTKIAETYSAQGKHDIVIFDLNKKILENIADRLDVFCVHDDGTRVSTLIDNGIQDANVFLSVTNNDSVNFFACSLAKKLNSKIKTVSLGSLQSWDLKNYLSLESLGVDHFLSPQVECANSITEIIQKPYFKEIVPLVQQENISVDIVNIKFMPGISLIGKSIEEIYKLNFMEKIQITFIWRKGQLLVAHDKMRINNYDEVYLVGEKEKIQELLDFIIVEEREITKVIFVGFDNICLQIITKLQEKGKYNLELINPDSHNTPQDIFSKESLPIPMVMSEFNQEIAEEIDLDEQTAVVCCLSDRSHSIMSALLAKKMGAQKAFVVVEDFDYQEILSSMDKIDACFNPYKSGINSIFSLNITGESYKRDFLLQRVPAEVYEFNVSQKSSLVNKKINKITLPEGVSFGLILRGKSLFTPRDNITLEKGDRVFLMAVSNSLKRIQQFVDTKNILVNIF